eukprot:scaffold187254_cov59-Attheya_sp.AAC.1
MQCTVSHEPMLPLMVTYIQNNLYSKGLTLGFPNSESPDCGQWQYSPTMLLKTLFYREWCVLYQEYVTGLMGTQPRRSGVVIG